MAILIQKLTNIVNIIDDTRPAGQKIVNSLSVDCVAKVQHKAPNPSTINIMDIEGMPTQIITFDGTVKVQDFGGVPVVYAGTLDGLCDKLNDEYFDNAVTSAGGGGGGGDASAANQVLEIAELQSIVTNTAATATATKQDTTITELQKLTGANAPSQQQLTNPAAVVISAFKKLSFVCTGTITVTIDGNAIIYPFNLGGGSKVYGSSFEADDVSTNAATFNGTGSVLLTIKQ
jgi:hypothetical protein